MTLSVCLCVAKINIIIEFEAEVVQVETRSFVLLCDKVPAVIQSLTHLQYLVFIARHCFP